MIKWIIRPLIKEQLKEYEDRIKYLENRLSNSESAISTREIQISRLLYDVDERIDNLRKGTEKLDKHIENKMRDTFELIDEYEKMKKSFNIRDR